MTQQTSKRRGRHDIVMEILKSAVNGAKKTHIMLKARLNFTQVELYLPPLREAGFISEDSGNWRTTEKGLHVIEACNICCSLIEDIP